MEDISPALLSYFLSQVCSQSPTSLFSQLMAALSPPGALLEAINTIPSSPPTQLIPATTTNTSLPDIANELTRIRTYLEEYGSHFERIISLCESKGIQEASRAVSRIWRKRLSELFTECTNSVIESPVHKVGVVFELIRLAYSFKHVDNHTHWTEFCMAISTLGDSINEALTNLVNSEQGDKMLVLKLCCDWLSVTMETVQHRNNEGSLSQVILKSLQKMVLEQIDKSAPDHSVEFITPMYTAKCLYFIYNHLHCLCKKWSSLKICSEINSVSEWVWQFYDDLVGHMIKYHTNLCTFSILQDTKSQDWTNCKPFFEGRRISFHIEMWRLHLFGLRADLWGHAPSCAAIRVLREVLCNTLDTLLVHYSSVTPSDKRIQQYRSDLTFVLTTVSLLLPSISDHTPSSAPHPHISLIHAHCSSLLSLTTNNIASVNNGDNVVSSWQDGLPLDRYRIIGCHGYKSTKELIGYLVSHPNPPKELLVELLVCDQCQFAVDMCTVSPSMSYHVLNILQDCYHSNTILTDFVNGIRDYKEPFEVCIQWISSYMMSALENVVVDSVVRYVSHYDDGSLASVMDSLVDCIVSSIDGIDNLIMSLLSSLTQDTVHKIIQTSVVNITSIDDVIMSKMPVPVRKPLIMFNDAFHLLFTNTGTNNEFEHAQQKLTTFVAGLSKRRSHDLDQDKLCQSDIRELIFPSGKADTESTRTIQAWIITNKSPPHYTDGQQFDPVNLCRLFQNETILL